MTVDGHRHVKRADAGQHLRGLLQQEMTGLNGLRGLTTRPGHLGGFPLTTTTERALGKTTVTLTLDGAPGTDIRIPATDLRDTDPVGLITRLENRLARLEERKAAALADAERARREITHARENLGQPFPHAAQLAEARERARQIDEQLQQMAGPQRPAEQAGPETSDTPPRIQGEPQPYGPQVPQRGDRPAIDVRRDPGHPSEHVPPPHGHRGDDPHHRSRMPAPRYRSPGRDLEAGE